MSVEAGESCGFERKGVTVKKKGGERVTRTQSQQGWVEVGLVQKVDEVAGDRAISTDRSFGPFLLSQTLVLKMEKQTLSQGKRLSLVTGGTGSRSSRN